MPSAKELIEQVASLNEFRIIGDSSTSKLTKISKVQSDITRAVRTAGLANSVELAELVRYNEIYCILDFKVPVDDDDVARLAKAVSSLIHRKARVHSVTIYKISISLPSDYVELVQ